MTRTWVEKLAFRMHRVAWRMIRYSIRRRMKRLGYAFAPLASWEELDMMDYANRVCMECCAEDLRAVRELILEERIASAARQLDPMVPEELLAQLRAARRSAHANSSSASTAAAPFAPYTTGPKGRACHPVHSAHDGHGKAERKKTPVH